MNENETIQLARMQYEVVKKRLQIAIDALEAIYMIDDPKLDEVKIYIRNILIKIKGN